MLGNDSIRRVFRGMETINRAEAKLGQQRFWYLAGAVFVLQATSVALIYAALGKDLLPSSVWFHLLGLAVGCLGTANGSKPVRYLLVFFLAVGVVQNTMVLVALQANTHAGMSWAASILLILSMLAAIGLALFMFVASQFRAWFHLQQARNYGLKVKMEESNSGHKENAKKESAKPLDQHLENDELGIFDEN